MRRRPGGDPRAAAAPLSVSRGPGRHAREYWISVRRALLRAKIDRIGLGGYLHLVEGFPDFVDCITEIADEFRAIRALHQSGGPAVLPLKVAVLHCWGGLRPWTLSGHFHETYMHDLIHIDEALSGLPVEVKFISFDDAKNGALEGVDVAVNAGRAGSAWSGGDAWSDPALVTALTRWVYQGGVFLGVGEPSALAGSWGCFRMREVLGIDRDTGARVCHGRWSFDVESVPGLLPEGCGVRGLEDLYLTDGAAKVLAVDERTGLPTVTAHPFGKGCGVYLSSFQVGPANTRMLLDLMLWAGGKGLDQPWLTGDPAAECAWFPAARQLVVINNSGEARTVRVTTDTAPVTVSLPPYGIHIETR